MTPDELYEITAAALAVTGPPEWQSPEAPDARDVLSYIADMDDGPTWCITPDEVGDAADFSDDYSDDFTEDRADDFSVGAEMARALLIDHFRAWLLARGWQIQATIRGEKQRWRLVDVLSIADGGGDRLDEDYPHGDDELRVLCESVIVLSKSASGP